MTLIKQYINFTKSATRQPLSFCRRVGHFSTLLGKLNLQYFEEMYELLDKECDALLDSRDGKVFISRQGDIVKDFSLVTQNYAGKYSQLFSESKESLGEVMEEAPYGTGGFEEAQSEKAA